MTTPLTPALALAYLHELSVDVRAAVVLDGTGASLAGDAALAAGARALLASAADTAAVLAPGVRSAAVAEGALLAAYVQDGGAIAVLAGHCALLPLLARDLATVADALATTLA
ncbi:MAG TPA: hypothetical protein VFF79_15275 [Conexibacter sp.]|jgi:hypothetical protein|nr:hypothetical protein [Conexibacter sp.]